MILPGWSEDLSVDSFFRAFVLVLKNDYIFTSLSVFKNNRKTYFR